MSASFTITGLDELRNVLEDLPERLKSQEIGPIIRATADGLASELKSAYPTVTGTLVNRITVEKKDELRARVRNRAPHAHLYEYGTVRRYTAGTGANRGTMPAKPTFVPAAVRWRARMMRAVKGSLQRLRIPGFRGSMDVRES